MEMKCVMVFLTKSWFLPTFFYLCKMKFIRKYIQKRRIEQTIYMEFKKALNEKDFDRSYLLSNRLLKLK